jgi:hypothetical protein
MYAYSKVLCLGNLQGDGPSDEGWPQKSFLL